LTKSATGHIGPEFGSEFPLHQPVCCFTEERYELLGCVAPIHVEGEQTALLAADIASQASQLSFFMVQCRAVSSYEGQHVGHERYNAIRIKEIYNRKFGAEVYE